MEYGKVYLVPTPIGNLKDITLRALEVLESVDEIAAEDTRQSLKLLNHFNIKKPLFSYHQHNEQGKSDEILSKLGSPKKVAQEIKQSFTETETMSEHKEQPVFHAEEKTSDDVIKKGLLIFVFIITLFISLFFFITALRLIIGGSLLFQLSFGLMFAVLGLGVVFLNLGIATFYLGYLGYKRMSERLN